MKKIKSTLRLVKNDIKKNPEQYVIAAAAGLTVGLVVYLLNRNNDEVPTTPVRLFLSKDVAENMIATGNSLLFETSAGNFNLSHVNY